MSTALWVALGWCAVSAAGVVLMNLGKLRGWLRHRLRRPLLLTDPLDEAGTDSVREVSERSPAGGPR